MENIDLYTYVIIPLLIFFARICDQSIGTLRIIFISKGYKYLAPLIGFFEVLIWVLAITKVMANLDNWICYVAYAGGFATGNYVGMLLEERLALGYEMIRVITKVDATNLIQAIRSMGYTATVVEAQGAEGKVGVIYIIINRKCIEKIVHVIQEHNPNALYTIEDIRFVNKDIRPWIPQEER
ncbi:MAG TPA: DUF2179 domain-containing protein [Bacteroidales bacterium]|jgi:uncharacterized protein YebE (UPF0316 family)|nr:DUF2179 domain-containing protein [Bacteroidales bacterium]HRS18514.1 DUF2179 domain-containing protein [Bacteroidales bacterium]